MDLGISAGTDSPVAVVLVMTAGWLVAGFLAEGLPGLPTALALRRRTGLLTGLLVALLALSAGVLQDMVGAADAGATVGIDPLVLPAVPTVLVTVTTLRRSTRLFAGAGAFRAAPATPTPPTLRAASAHPMLALPVQLTGLMMLPIAVAAAGLAPLDSPGVRGLVITAAVLVSSTNWIRHALRHSRLAETAITIRPSSPRTTGVLHV